MKLLKNSLIKYLIINIVCIKNESNNIFLLKPAGYRNRENR